MVDHLSFKKQLSEGLMSDSALDIHTAIKSKLTEAFNRQVKGLLESDPIDQTAQVMAACATYGGYDAEGHNGVILVKFRTRAGALGYVEYLEGVDSVDEYEISAEMKNAPTDAMVPVIDIDTIYDDQKYEFLVTVYIKPEFVVFDDDYDNDGDEDTEDFEAAVDAEMTPEGFMETGDLITEDIEIDEATFVVRHDGVPADHEHAALFHGKTGVINHVTKYADSATKTAAMLKKNNFLNVRVEKDGKVMTEGLQIDEVMRKIRINARGTRSIKMKCMPGFKWDRTISACVKISGSQLAVMRKATRHAIITKKSMGGAFKIRVKRRILKAFKFRKMAGLKV